ncbi:MAG: cyclase/dehydrase [Frankiales bacterium]|nr:cyclase/dehydrase [Frankiales bacterium]
MASISAQVEVQSDPEAILDVIADFERYPDWSPMHVAASVESRDAQHMPERVSIEATAMGVVDHQILDYRWSANAVHWSLVSSGQQKAQNGSYSLAVLAPGRTLLSYEITVDPVIRVPEVLLRQILKKAATVATEGLRDRVESTRG